MMILSDYVGLLQMTSTVSLYIGHLKFIIQDIFIIIKDLSLVFLNVLFTKKMVPYDLRNDYALKYQGVILYIWYQLTGISGTKLLDCGVVWRVLSNKISESIAEFKSFMSIEGPYF